MEYCSSNPIITASDAQRLSAGKLKVIGAFNPGAAQFNGKTVLLVRVAEQFEPETGCMEIPIAKDGGVTRLKIAKDGRYDFGDPRVIAGRKGEKYLTSLSKLLVAQSDDGVNFSFTGNGIIPQGGYEAFGAEDPRITFIDGAYYITYTAVSAMGVCVALARTSDFVSFERLGIVLPPDNKDAVLFPEKIGGKYYMLHRPSASEFARPEMWIAESEDLIRWGNHRRLCGVRDGWDCARIGAGPAPVKTKDGWLTVYHGADEDNRYCMGALLLDPQKPWIVRKRSEKPFMEPVNGYETDGFFGGAVFSCGMIASGDKLRIYYGAADDKICLAYADTDEITAGMSDVAGGTDN